MSGAGSMDGWLEHASLSVKLTKRSWTGKRMKARLSAGALKSHSCEPVAAFSCSLQCSLPASDLPCGPLINQAHLAHKRASSFDIVALQQFPYTLPISCNIERNGQVRAQVYSIYYTLLQVSVLSGCKRLHPRPSRSRWL